MDGIEEATKRAAVLWLRLGSGDVLPVWHLWHDAAVFVVGGDLEQSLDGLLPGAAVTVVVPAPRQGAAVLQWVAAVGAVEPGSPEWDEVTPLLAAKRLNAPDGRRAPQRWAVESVVLRLTPTGETVPLTG